MQEILKALLPGFPDGDMHMPAQKLAILISRERKGLSDGYFIFPSYMQPVVTPNASHTKIYVGGGFGHKCRAAPNH